MVLEVRWIPKDQPAPEGWAENDDHRDDPVHHHVYSRLVTRWVKAR